jgi:glycosyltransferase involved in cell wall biosynthesis
MARATIGVPVYNGAGNLAECLGCLSDQTESDIEIVVSVNKSSDNSLDIARAAAARDPRIRLLEQTETIPAMQNFASVLDACRTPYFLWRAHDDLSAPNYVATLADALDRTPDATLAVGDFKQRVYRGPKLRREDDVPFPDRPDGRFDAMLHDLEHFQSSWIYGLWRTDALRAVSSRIWAAYPTPWAGDRRNILPQIRDRSVAHAPGTYFVRQKFKDERRGESDARPPEGDRFASLAGEFRSVLSAEIAGRDFPDDERATLDRIARILSTTWVRAREGAFRRRLRARRAETAGAEPG